MTGVYWLDGSNHYDYWWLIRRFTGPSSMIRWLGRWLNHPSFGAESWSEWWRSVVTMQIIVPWLDDNLWTFLHMGVSQNTVGDLPNHPIKTFLTITPPFFGVPPISRNHHMTGWLHLYHCHPIVFPVPFYRSSDVDSYSTTATDEYTSRSLAPYNHDNQKPLIPNVSAQAMVTIHQRRDWDQITSPYNHVWQPCIGTWLLNNNRNRASQFTIIDHD